VASHLVIIPTYNEADNISRMIDVVLALSVGFHVLVVDDGSPDGTADLVGHRCIQFPDRVFLLSRHEKNGVGMAYVAGFIWAQQAGYDFVYELDSDFSHPPEDLVVMAQLLSSRQADLVVGSRYIDGVRVINWPMKRLLLSYFASMYTRFWTRLPVQDTTAGFMGYRLRVMDCLALDRFQFRGYLFQIVMKFLVWKKGFVIREIPIIFSERRDGQTKMNASIFWEALVWVIFLPLIYQKYYR